MPAEQQFGTESEGISLLKSRLGGFETEDGRLKGLNYQPRVNDVAITTTPKAGTTWLQQIRSASKGGDMSFSEISEVVPWLELAADQGQDLEAAQHGDKEELPRFFKTHAWADHCPNFPKTIVVLRNPDDVLLSFYRFFEDWFFDKGSISLDSFADEFWLSRGIPENMMQNASYFIHLLSWYRRKDDPSVLILFFEDLLEDLEGQVTRVARFVSTEKHNFETPETIRHTVESSTYAFMKKNESHFDEKLSKLSRNEACGLPKDAGMQKSKIVNGKKGEGTLQLSRRLRDAIQMKWKEVVQPETGCESYEALRQKFKTMNSKSSI
ncbi:MAG: hypothetical protein SGBAC_005411 [Bacillariaceae sp.]